jgi:hypothetical protein
MAILFIRHKKDYILIRIAQIGAGVKMLTGKFEEANNLGTVNQSFNWGQEVGIIFCYRILIKKKT